MDFAASYRQRAEALEAYLDEIFLKFEAERARYAAEHVRSVFRNFDLDDSGAIDRYEFSRACERLSPTMSPEDIEDALSIIDADGDGDITYEEFKKWWNSDHAVTLRENADAEIGKVNDIDEIALVTTWEATRARLEKEKLHRAFASIDEDGSGLIDFSEFRRLCRRMNAKMSDEEIKMTFAIVDADGSGEVDFSEFAEWWETEDGRRLRGEQGKSCSDFSLQELLDAVAARTKDRKAEHERERFARCVSSSTYMPSDCNASNMPIVRNTCACRKKRVAKQQAGWAAVRAERQAIADAKAAAVATEQRLQAAALEKLRAVREAEKLKQLEEHQHQRRYAQRNCLRFECLLINCFPSHVALTDIFAAAIIPQVAARAAPGRPAQCNTQYQQPN